MPVIGLVLHADPPVPKVLSKYCAGPFLVHLLVYLSVRPRGRRFTNTLALMVCVSIAWIMYEMYFKARKLQR